MPYKSVSDINKSKRKGMTRHGAEIYKSAFNAALKQYGNEGQAHAVANAAVTKAGQRKKKREGLVMDRIEQLAESVGSFAELVEKKWMQKVAAKLKKGALHKQLGIPQGKKIPTSVLRKAAKKGGKLAKRANLALRFRGK